ncbi:MAG: 6-phosphofructokinase [Clostridia bacterium]|nr:6-phosphofructokinase [Clostridia bacterium]
MKKLRGNAIVGQSGGPTAAINATLAGVIRGAFADECIVKLYGMLNGIEGILRENLVCLNDRFASEEEISRLEHTPAAALGSCRKKMPDISTGLDTYEKILEVFQKHDIRYFFYIGGNDSMDTVAKLSAFFANRGYDIRIIGVPKTIDNDLVLTDHTPGYGTAAKYIAVTTQEIIRDCAVYNTPAVTIVEIMGRNAGWLAAAADIGKYIGRESPDAVYFPEKDFNMESFFEDVENALKKHPNVLIAVSEGIRFADGRYVGEGQQSGAVDVFGHKYLSGAAKVLEGAVKERFGCKVRSVELSLPQRCSSHVASETDLCESVMIGKAAVAAAADEGVTGVMMAYRRISEKPYKIDVIYSDVSKIANEVKELPDEYINERGNGITAECADYILPLIQGEAYPEYIDGVPSYFII